MVLISSNNKVSVTVSGEDNYDAQASSDDCSQDAILHNKNIEEQNYGDDEEEVDAGNEEKPYHNIKSILKNTWSTESAVITHLIRSSSTINIPVSRTSSSVGDSDTMFEPHYDSVSSSNSSVSSFICTKSHKKVHFTTTDALIGFSEFDNSEMLGQKTYHEICRERRALKEQRREDVYTLFENDPDFEELEILTRSLTMHNKTIGLS